MSLCHKLFTHKTKLPQHHRLNIYKKYTAWLYPLANKYFYIYGLVDMLILDLRD